jgi:carbon monoxide dehydrogenase subunit G
MNWFSATTSSQADVSADRAEVWDVLTDPDALAELTPLLRSIDVDGDLWRWCFTQVPLLGLAVTPAFTERMHFRAKERIDYEHAPPEGSHERFGVEGWYTLDDAADGTRLAVSMTVRVQLPLARIAAPAVTRVMESVLARTGDGFSRNFERRLGAA